MNRTTIQRLARCAPNVLLKSIFQTIVIWCEKGCAFVVFTLRHWHCAHECIKKLHVCVHCTLHMQNCYNASYTHIHFKYPIPTVTDTLSVCIQRKWVKVILGRNSGKFWCVFAIDSVCFHYTLAIFFCFIQFKIKSQILNYSLFENHIVIENCCSKKQISQ